MAAVSTSAHHKPPSAVTRWVIAHPLVTFFGLAYAITFGIIGGVMLAVSSGAMTEESPLIAILLQLYSFGPALAALIAATAIGGLCGLRTLLGSLDPRRIGLIWYPLALVTPPLALALGTAVVFGMAPLVSLAAQWPALFTRYLLPVLTTVLLTTGIAEELGWRGFAQPRLQTCYGPLSGSLILGVGAALWHLPNAVLRPGGLAIFALQVLTVIMMAVLGTWFYNRNRGSVLIVALLHAAINTSGRLMAPLVPIADRALLTQHIWMVSVAVMSLVTLVLIIGTRGRLGLAPDNDDADTR